MALLRMLELGDVAQYEQRQLALLADALDGDEPGAELPQRLALRPAQQPVYRRRPDAATARWPRAFRAGRRRGRKPASGLPTIAAMVEPAAPAVAWLVKSNALVPGDEQRQHVEVVGDRVQQVGLALQSRGLVGKLLGLVARPHAAAVAPRGDGDGGDGKQQQRQRDQQEAATLVGEAERLGGVDLLGEHPVLAADRAAHLQHRLAAVVVQHAEAGPASCTAEISARSARSAGSVRRSAGRAVAGGRQKRDRVAALLEQQRLRLSSANEGPRVSSGKSSSSALRTPISTPAAPPAQGRRRPAPC